MVCVPSLGEIRRRRSSRSRHPGGWDRHPQAAASPRSVRRSMVMPSFLRRVCVSVEGWPSLPSSDKTRIVDRRRTGVCSPAHECPVCSPVGSSPGGQFPIRDHRGDTGLRRLLSGNRGGVRREAFLCCPSGRSNRQMRSCYERKHVPRVILWPPAEWHPPTVSGIRAVVNTRACEPVAALARVGRTAVNTGRKVGWPIAPPSRLPRSMPRRVLSGDFEWNVSNQLDPSLALGPRGFHRTSDSNGFPSPS